MWPGHERHLGTVANTRGAFVIPGHPSRYLAAARVDHAARAPGPRREGPRQWLTAAVNDARLGMRAARLRASTPPLAPPTREPRRTHRSASRAKRTAGPSPSRQTHARVNDNDALWREPKRVAEPPQSVASSRPFSGHSRRCPLPIAHRWPQRGASVHFRALLWPWRTVARAAIAPPVTPDEDICTDLASFVRVAPRLRPPPLASLA